MCLWKTEASSGKSLSLYLSYMSRMSPSTKSPILLKICLSRICHCMSELKAVRSHKQAPSHTQERESKITTTKKKPKNQNPVWR